MGVLLRGIKLATLPVWWIISMEMLLVAKVMDRLHIRSQDLADYPFNMLCVGYIAGALNVMLIGWGYHVFH